MFKVIYYSDKRSQKPVEEFISTLQEKAATSKDAREKLNKSTVYIRLLKEHGTRAGMPFTRHLDDGIWELRPLNIRILYFYWENNIYVLVHHYIKKSQKAPQKEINIAKERRKDFLERSNKDD